MSSNYRRNTISPPAQSRPILGVIKILLMLRQLILLIQLLTTTLVWGQVGDKTYRNQFKISPLRILDPVNPGFELSYERLHSKRFSTQLSFARLTNVIAKHYPDFRGYRISLEEKYFLKAASKTSRYISVDMIHTDSNFEDMTTFRDTVNNMNNTETFSVTRKTTSFNFKYSKQLELNRFILDVCIGMGIKYRDVVHKNRTLPTIPIKEPEILSSSKAEGKNVTLNLPLNLKLGYMF